MRIDPDAPGAKDSVEPASNLRRQRLRKQRPRSDLRQRLGVRSLRHSGPGTARHQQRQNVAGRQRRVGTIRERQAIRRPGKVHGNVILLHAGLDAQAQNRLDAEGIQERNLAPADRILLPGKVEFSLQDSDPAEPDGVLHGALHPQVHVALQIPRCAGVQADVGSGNHMEVQAQVSDERIPGRGSALVALTQQNLRQVELRVDALPPNHQAARQQALVRSPAPGQPPAEYGTDPRRVSHADRFGIRRKLELPAVRVCIGHKSAELHLPSATFRREVFEQPSIPLKNHSAFDLRETVGQIAVSEGAVGEEQAASPLGFRQRTVEKAIE